MKATAAQAEAALSTLLSSSIFEPPAALEPTKAIEPPAEQSNQPVTSPATAESPVTIPTATASDFSTLIQGVIKAVTPKEKLLLPKLTTFSKSAYSMWRKEAMLTIHLHSLFTSHITSSPITGKLTISTDLPTTPKGIIYMSLSKAIDTKVKKEVGWDTMTDSDGVAMLQKLEDKLGLKQDSTLGTIDLLSDLNKDKKDAREKLSTYHRRFTHAVDECIANNVMPYDDPVLIILYLWNINEVCLHPAILSLQQG